MGRKIEYSDVARKVLKDIVFSVIKDREIKANIKSVQQLINEAPGNKGGAEMLIDYYNNCK